MAITLISTVTVGAGGAASIDFTSIPGTYTDLMVVLSGSLNSGAVSDWVNLRFNGSSAASYSDRTLRGTGSAASSLSNSSVTEITLGQVDSSTATANTFGNLCAYIPNYAGSTNKSVSADSVTETNGTFGRQYIVAGLWSNTAAITSISLFNVFGGSWLQYSSASLYGVKSGSSGGVTVS